jgi:hypothetical protein
MKKWIGGILCIGLLGWACFVVVSKSLTVAIASPKLVSANVIIKEAGSFGSPLNSQMVRIWPEPDGSLKFFVNNQKAIGNGSGPAAAFEANSDWLMCWDFKDRLWTYIPEQDGQYCRCWYSSEKGSGTTLVGEFGGWDGIPEAFLANLPEKMKAIHATYASNQPQ